MSGHPICLELMGFSPANPGLSEIGVLPAGVCGPPTFPQPILTLCHCALPSPPRPSPPLPAPALTSGLRLCTVPSYLQTLEGRWGQGCSRLESCPRDWGREGMTVIEREVELGPSRAGEVSHSHELTGPAPQARGWWRAQEGIQPWELPGQKPGTGQCVPCRGIQESSDVVIAWGTWGGEGAERESRVIPKGLQG